MPPNKNNSSDTELSDIARQIDEAAKAVDLRDPDEGKHWVDRSINRLVEVTGVCVLMTIVLLVFFNAVGRYTIGLTFIWADEIVLGLLPWLGMLGMFLSVRRRQIIRIEFFVKLFPPVMHRTLTILGSFVAAAAFIYLALVSIQYLELFGRDRTVYLRLERGWFMSAMVIGPALTAIAYVLLVLDHLRGKAPDDDGSD